MKGISSRCIVQREANDGAPGVKKLLRWSGMALAAMAIAVAVLVMLIRLELRQSLPLYAGELAIPGLHDSVIVERDALGVARIMSSGELDEARAIGFVHAQERFFQMDLFRRSAAGELAALVGESAIEVDRQRRIHQMRATAEKVLAGASDARRTLLEAYAEGVNAGLAALGARPWEYLLLRREPESWTAVDSVLVIAAMYFELDDELGAAAKNEAVARAALPAAFADFLYPSSTEWDAPVMGSPGPPAVIPAADVYDLRRLPAEVFRSAALTRSRPSIVDEATQPGSNSWALSGQRTANGAGLLANDPHLGLGVPSIWYRLVLEREGRTVAGLSLPGMPVVTLGSNGSIAWGMTNSYGEWTELIVLETDPSEPSRYRTPEGLRTIEEVASPIEIANGKTEAFRVQQTVFGPVAGRMPDGSPYVVHWVAHDVRAYALEFFDLANATTVDEALGIVQRSGAPLQNFLAADSRGNIGWTILGSMPSRARRDRVSRSSEGSAWNGWLEPEAYPVIVNPPGGAIWTANGRVVDGPMFTRIGGRDFALGMRAGRIRDLLAGVDAAEPADMLAIQLDDDAHVLDRWRSELLRLLADATDPVHVAVRNAVLDWGGHAAVDSVGYRLVREWRRLMLDRILFALSTGIRAQDPEWTYTGFKAEHWAWPIIRDEPPHLLDPGYVSWRAFKLGALDEHLRDELDVDSPEALARHTWGERNTISVHHVLSAAMPMLARWLDMPAIQLPGDTLMPRVQALEFGSSARFAVSPGSEAAGYLHMPGGQSGHPLSPYYGAGHEDWAAGRPTPFLAGESDATLRLVPRP